MNKHVRAVLSFLIGLSICLSISIVLTAIFIRNDVFSFSKIWLFNSIFTNAVVNIGILILSLIIIYFIRGSNTLTQKAISSFLICTLFHTSFLGIVVVSYNRSISVYFLSSLYELNRPLKYRELNRLLWDGYFLGLDATSRRNKEQTIIGNMAVNESGGFYLTNKGKAFIESSRKIAEIYKVKRGFLWPDPHKTLNSKKNSKTKNLIEKDRL